MYMMRNGDVFENEFWKWSFFVRVRPRRNVFDVSCLSGREKSLSLSDVARPHTHTHTYTPHNLENHGHSIVLFEERGGEKEEEEEKDRLFCHFRVVLSVQDEKEKEQ